MMFLSDVLFVDQQQKTEEEETYRQEREMVSQDAAQGRRCSDIDLSELSRCHLAMGALAEVDGAQRQRQSPQAAALRQLP